MSSRSLSCRIGKGIAIIWFLRLSRVGVRGKKELRGTDYNIINAVETRRKSFSWQAMFISTGPDGFRLFASSDSTIFFLWTASSVTPTLNNPFYAIDKKGLKPCPHNDRSRQRTYCTINDLEVYTEYEFSLILCDQPSLDNRTRCTSPSRATKRTRPQRMFLLGAYLASAPHLRAVFTFF